MPLDPLWLSLRCTGAVLLVTVVLGLPLAWILACRNFPGHDLLSTLSNLPLALPPAVFVYYLLAGSGRLPLRFSWRAAELLSCVYTLPLFLRILRAGLETVRPWFANAARSMGASEWRIFWRISLPLARRALLGALLAAFARAFADFSITAIFASLPRDSPEVALVLLTAAVLTFAALYIATRVERARVRP